MEYRYRYLYDTNTGKSAVLILIPEDSYKFLWIPNVLLIPKIGYWIILIWIMKFCTNTITKRPIQKVFLYQMNTTKNRINEYYWLHKQQVSMRWYSLIHVDRGWFGLIRVDTGWYELIWVDKGWYRLIRVDTAWYGLIRIDTGWYGLMWVATVWLGLIWVDSGWKIR